MTLRTSILLLTCGLCELTQCAASDPMASPAPPPVRDASRQFEGRAASWQAIKQRNVVMQRHEYTCGAAALATMFQYYFGDDVSEKKVLQVVRENLVRVKGEAEWRQRFESGLSMKDLEDAAKGLKYDATVLTDRKVKDRLGDLKTPIVIRLVQGEFAHFVVLRGAPVQDVVFLADPIRGQVKMPVRELDAQWDGATLFLSKPGFRPQLDHPLKVPQGPDIYNEFQATRRFLQLQQSR